MTRILVTGGNGLIGQWIQSKLRSVPTNIVLAPNHQTFDVLIEDERWDTIFSQRWDILIHCAWMTAHGEFWNSPINEAWRDASLRLFDRFYRQGGQRIVALGTCAEYDWKDLEGPLSEGSACQPHTFYGQMKNETRLGLEALAKAQEKRSFLWPRIFFAFGSGESPNKLIPSMVRAHLTRQAMQCGPADTARDFCDFEMIGKTIAKLAPMTVSGPINIGSGQALSLASIYEMVCKIHGAGSFVDFKTSVAGKPDIIEADISKLMSLCGEIDYPAFWARLEAYIKHLSDTKNYP